jgi:hypothetical protein
MVVNFGAFPAGVTFGYVVQLSGSYGRPLIRIDPTRQLILEPHLEHEGANSPALD